MNVTLVVTYPSDYDTLTLWSKRMFAIYYAFGLLGAGALVAAAVLGFNGSPWWLWLSLLAVGVIGGGGVHVTIPLMVEIERRRYAPDPEASADGRR